MIEALVTGLILGQVILAFSVIKAFKLGYKAGRKEDSLKEISEPEFDVEGLINQEEKAPKTEEEILEDMQRAITLARGYDG